MSSEFTGERVIPGQVDVDLWNEHISRYAFASRYASGARVLDIGCGTGYGTAELAQCAATCTGIDVSHDALCYASEHYRGIRWVQASATSIPFRDEAFDMLTCFEVIEHLEDWRALLHEARRLLSPSGKLLVSTPNRSFYAETRKLSGPNPFHVHEFDYQEFRDALEGLFPHVSIYTQDHTAGLSFRAPHRDAPGELSIGSGAFDPDVSNFYIAVCSPEPEERPSHFFFVPSEANMLRQRALHIERLQSELRLKEQWIAEARKERDQVARMLQACEADLVERSAWGAKLDKELAEANEYVVQLQAELRAANEALNAYEARVAELNAEVEARTKWALDTEQSLTEELVAARAELVRCIALLDDAEKRVEERTLWAQSLEQEKTHLENALAESRWLKLGRALGLGPEMPKQ
ncbi:MAG TPA: methyltransferase domain-containing protein [Bryobacteraceae bacterium]|nr:methyltransferase domain-containing protein [Bryobacteraceae bacterium]